MPVLGSISSCQAASSSQLSFRLAGAWGIPVPGGIAQTFNLLAPESTAETGLRREVARAGLLGGEGGGKQSWSLLREGFQDPHRGYTKLSHVFFQGFVHVWCRSLQSLATFGSSCISERGAGCRPSQQMEHGKASICPLTPALPLKPSI